MRGEKKVTKQRSDPVQYQYTHTLLAFGFFSLNVLSSLQNRINIRISKIYTTSVINVIVTFIQSTLSKTLGSQRRLAVRTGAKKIQGHFGIDYRQGLCATCGPEYKINIQLARTRRH